MKIRGQWLTSLLFSVFTIACVPLAVAQKAEVRVTKVALPLPGGSITADRFEPPTRQRRPAILVLHGAGGSLLDGPEMKRVARYLAENGNAVYVVHYFERTGTLFARDATMQKNYETWLETVRESIAAVQKLRADSAPVGIYGYSLGAFLALQAASDNRHVAAVVEQAGGVWNGKLDRLGKLPPVLMIHGREDARVPFDKYAQPLIPVLHAHSRQFETKLFPDEGHGFTPAAMNEVRHAAAEFFHRELATR